MTSPDKTKYTAKAGPSGRTIIYDEDGKPCRSCNELVDFQFAIGKGSKTASLPSVTRNINKNVVQKFGLIPGSRTYRKIPPPSKDEIGNSSWMLLHAVGARYSQTPPDSEKREMSRFIELFAKVYPVEEHGRNMSGYIDQHKVSVENRTEFGNWLSTFHNAINKQLGKEPFDTKFWEDRWVNGWD